MMHSDAEKFYKEELEKKVLILVLMDDALWRCTKISIHNRES